MHISAVLCVIQIGFQIKTRVQDLGHGCIFLVQKAGALQITPSDSFTKRELIDCARAVTEKVMPADSCEAKLLLCSELQQLKRVRSLIAFISSLLN